MLTAEKIKKEIASLESGDALSTLVNGRDSSTGAPKSISLRALDIATPIKQYYDKIAEIAMSVLKKLPPEVSAEIRHGGIYVSGDSSNVYGLKHYFEQKFEMPVYVSPDATYAVALGGGVVLGDGELLKKIANIYK